MNRSLTNVLFGGIGTPISTEAHKIEGTITKTTVDDTADALANADSVILVRALLIGALFILTVLISLGRWLWNGSSKSTVRYFRNHGYATIKGHHCPRESSGCFYFMVFFARKLTLHT